MVRLKQIEIKDRIASAFYYPEDKAESGVIKVNIDTGEVIDYSPVEGFSYSYVYHAARELKRIAANNESRTESISIWY